jgi:site-specific recombinase XerD
MVQRGVPLAVVQAWMGHSSINTTMRYAHLAPGSLQVGREALEQVKVQPQLMVVNG